MQIQKIANTNFGSSIAYEQVKNNPNKFYFLNPADKQDVLYDMLQKAHEERKTIVNNQHALLGYMSGGMKELAYILDGIRCRYVYDVFQGSSLKNL